MEKNILCNDTGVCIVGEETDTNIHFTSTNEKIDFYYFTDPACSYCYLLEPILHKFLLEYGHLLNVHFVMGGLLQNVEKQEQFDAIYVNWNTLKEQAHLPINPKIWKEDPIWTTFHVGMVYEIVKKIDLEKANIFLRHSRFLTFLHKQNIAKYEVLEHVLTKLDLDAKAIIEQVKREQTLLLEEGFYTARSFGVTSYPTIILSNSDNDGAIIKGIRPYSTLTNALKDLTKSKLLLKQPLPSLEETIKRFKGLFEVEISYIYDQNFSDVKSFYQTELKQTSYMTKDYLGYTFVYFEDHIL